MGHMRVKDPQGGGNQSGLRDQNARLVLSYIRRHGAMASAEIARRSGLSAQTVSNIVRALETDGLLTREATVKGRVGKPSVPMALNPSGVYSLGLSIGRRSLELVLVDFKGQQVDAEVASYAYPDRTIVFDFVHRQTPKILARKGISKDKVAGLGIARPNQIWNWIEFVNAPDTGMKDWQMVDFEADFAALAGLDVTLENDATAACIAEQLLGRGQGYSDFIYIFMGNFVGGGLVLGDKVISGRTHNAAAMGPLPVPDGKGGTVQLLDVASLHVLETAVIKANLDSDRLRRPGADWSQLEPMLSDWIDTTARHLAVASAAIASIVEVEAILIDGAFPTTVRSSLTCQIQTAFSNLDITGLKRPQIESGAVGRRARSIGAALLPIHAGFFVN